MLHHPHTMPLFHPSKKMLIIFATVGIILMTASSSCVNVNAFHPTLLTLNPSRSTSPAPSHSTRYSTAAATIRNIHPTRKSNSILSLNSSRVTTLFAEILLLDDKKKKTSSSSMNQDSPSSSEASFYPFHCGHVGIGWEDTYFDSRQQNYGDTMRESSDFSLTETTSSSFIALSTLSSSSSSSLLLLHPQPAIAASNGGGSSAINKLIISQGDFNPDSFRPICSNSDAFYRLLQSSTRSIVGDDNFVEYGPLIAGGLLRIRLELCVVESFFNEAVGPFIQQNGLNWILPLHESVATFLAGTIFALATTFILVSSTKVIQILAFYGDLIIGGPCRLFGGFFFDRARGEPVTLDVSFFGFFKTRLVGPPVDFEEEMKNKKNNSRWGEEGKVLLLDLEKVKPTDVPLLALSGSVKLVGEASKIFREFIEALDLFVGRYLVLIASGYIILKVLHFKVFPDFP